MLPNILKLLIQCGTVTSAIGITENQLTRLLSLIIYDGIPSPLLLHSLYLHLVGMEPPFRNKESTLVMTWPLSSYRHQE